MNRWGSLGPTFWLCLPLLLTSDGALNERTAPKLITSAATLKSADVLNEMPLWSHVTFFVYYDPLCRRSVFSFAFLGFLGNFHWNSPWQKMSQSPEPLHVKAQSICNLKYCPQEYNWYCLCQSYRASEMKLKIQELIDSEEEVFAIYADVNKDIHDFEGYIEYTSGLNLKNAKAILRVAKSMRAVKVYTGTVLCVSFEHKRKQAAAEICESMIEGRFFNLPQTTTQGGSRCGNVGLNFNLDIKIPFFDSPNWTVPTKTLKVPVGSVCTMHVADNFDYTCEATCHVNLRLKSGFQVVAAILTTEASGHLNGIVSFPESPALVNKVNKFDSYIICGPDCEIEDNDHTIWLTCQSGIRAEIQKGPIASISNYDPSTVPVSTRPSLQKSKVGIAVSANLREVNSTKKTCTNSALGAEVDSPPLKLSKELLMGKFKRLHFPANEKGIAHQQAFVAMVKAMMNTPASAIIKFRVGTWSPISHGTQFSPFKPKGHDTYRLSLSRVRPLTYEITTSGRIVENTRSIEKPKTGIQVALSYGATDIARELPHAKRAYIVPGSGWKFKRGRKPRFDYFGTGNLSLEILGLDSTLKGESSLDFTASGIEKSGVKVVVFDLDTFILTRLNIQQEFLTPSPQAVELMLHLQMLGIRVWLLADTESCKDMDPKLQKQKEDEFVKLGREKSVPNNKIKRNYKIQDVYEKYFSYVSTSDLEKALRHDNRTQKSWGRDSSFEIPVIRIWDEETTDESNAAKRKTPSCLGNAVMNGMGVAKNLRILYDEDEKTISETPPNIYEKRVDAEREKKIKRVNMIRVAEGVAEYNILFISSDMKLAKLSVENGILAMHSKSKFAFAKEDLKLPFGDRSFNKIRSEDWQSLRSSLSQKKQIILASLDSEISSCAKQLMTAWKEFQNAAAELSKADLGWETAKGYRRTVLLETIFIDARQNFISAKEEFRQVLTGG